MSDKNFTKAEARRLRELALTANQAIAAHQSFLEFLREQHDAPETDGWVLGPNGFEKAEPSDDGVPQPVGDDV